MTAEKVKKKVKVQVNLDDANVGIPPFYYEWQGQVYALDLLDLVTKFGPYVEAIKADPTSILPKFKRIIDQENMPESKVIFLISKVTEKMLEIFGSKKNSRALLKHLGFTRGLTSKLSENLHQKKEPHSTS